MWQEWAFYFVSPFTLALGLWLASAVALGLDRRRLALALSIVGLAGLWVASLPVVGDGLTRILESRYPALTAQATPAADAIVILGGAVAGAQPPERPTFVLSASSTRVVHAAALYRAGKAKWIVVAGGNRPGHERVQVEADAIAEFLGQLGVPRSAIRLERQSRTTRENAANAKAIVQELGARRVLLVTSAVHMPRALATFRKMWAPANIELIPAVTDVRVIPGQASGLKLWLPSPDSALSVTNALKEFAGMAALAIIR